MPRANPSVSLSATPSAVVIAIEMPGFAKSPVPEQLKARENLHQRLAQALLPIPHQDRIVLDTGNVVAIALFGSVRAAMAVASMLRAPSREGNSRFALRIVLTIGPAQAFSRDNGEVQVAGDALDVAERILALPSEEQVLANRAFSSALGEEVPGCDAALKSLGTFTDDQVREHELFSLEPAHPSLAATGQTTPGRGEWALPRAAMAGAGIALLAVLAFLTVRSLQAPPSKPDMAAEASTTPKQTLAAQAAHQQEPALPSLPPPPATAKIEDEAPSQVVAAANSLPITVAPPGTVALPGLAVNEISIESEESLPESDGERGNLVLAIAPWGEVLIDGKSAGISPPLREIKLSPGSHYVEVRNGGFAPLLKRIDIQAKETLKIRHRFADAR
ncbi:MAG: PEGA domain-containing protein [Betaproteobacteria bacterium]|nr:PEGA domain-containing protein [Betaproteobacteria bacterium]